MKPTKLGLLFLLVSFFAPSPSLAQEGGRYEPISYIMKDITAICVPKFIKNGKTYFSILIYNRSRNSKTIIYKQKHYNSLKEVFSALKNIQTPIQDMKFSEMNFYFGVKAKEFIEETEGIKLISFTPSEHIEMEKIIKELLSSKQSSSINEANKNNKK